MTSKSTGSAVARMLIGGLALACSSANVPDGEGGSPESAPSESVVTSPPLTAQQRLDACAQDPRVTAGLVKASTCAGADIFFRETFDGNGRTCGSCHPVANNTTLDAPFIEALYAKNPKDPLFVFETNPALRELETTDLHEFAAILENVDGFQDPTQRFVSRTVNHVLSLATSITVDDEDGTANPPIERTGWAGDGAPKDGSLLAFLEGAVTQHFTKELARRPSVDFRVPTAQEAELTRAFQLSLGRLNELDLEQVRIFDAEGEEGRLAFMSAERGRCNVCHSNAGANFIDTKENRNFDNGVRASSTVRNLVNGRVGDVVMRDGGFGGAELELPNIGENGGPNNGFGDGTFSPPPLIEAADTAPFFHNALLRNSQAIDSIDHAVGFYATIAFNNSPGAKFLEERFGGPFDLTAQDSSRIARFLRVLNGAFNIDIALQRLDAARKLALRFGDTRADIQKRLMELAVVEIDDAMEVLSGVNLYPDAQAQLTQAKAEISAGLAATAWSERDDRIAAAVSKSESARSFFGSKIDFELGEGNLMF